MINFLEPPQEQLNSLLECYQTGRYVDAEKLSVSITEEFPKHPFAWKVLAGVLKQMGKINESLVAGQKSVQLDPQDAGAHNNLGVLLQQAQGRSINTPEQETTEEEDSQESKVRQDLLLQP